MKLTIVIEEAEEGGYVGQFEEFPAVIEQGETIEDLKSNLFKSLDFYLDTQRWLFQKQLSNKEVKRQTFEFAL